MACTGKRCTQGCIGRGTQGGYIVPRGVPRVYTRVSLGLSWAQKGVPRVKTGVTDGTRG